MYEDSKQRVWIELETPVVVALTKKQVAGGNALTANTVRTSEEAKALMERRAKLASNMLRRLGVEGEDRIIVHVEKDVPYYAALDASKMLTVLNDSGQWFNLGYLGRED